MRTIKILLVFFALALAADYPKANAQNLISQKDAAKIAVNYITIKKFRSSPLMGIAFYCILPTKATPISHLWIFN